TDMVRHPTLYQLNSRVLLAELGRKLGQRASLDDLPDATPRRQAVTRAPAADILGQAELLTQPLKAHALARLPMHARPRRTEGARKPPPEKRPGRAPIRRST